MKRKPWPNTSTNISRPSANTPAENASTACDPFKIADCKLQIADLRDKYNCVENGLGKLQVCNLCFQICNLKSAISVILVLSPAPTGHRFSHCRCRHVPGRTAGRRGGSGKSRPED